MTTVTVDRVIDLSSLPFPASSTADYSPDGSVTATVTADVPERDLRAAVDGAPAAPPPPSPVEERVQSVEERVLPPTDPAERTRYDQLHTAIEQALATLQTLIDAPPVPEVPTGTMTTAQLSNVCRALRDVVQGNRAGAQQVARTLRDTIRLVRGDFGDLGP